MRKSLQLARTSRNSRVVGIINSKYFPCFTSLRLNMHYWNLRDAKQQQQQQQNQQHQQKDLDESVLKKKFEHTTWYWGCDEKHFQMI